MSEVVDCISWIVRKTCWSFWICMKFIGLRLLDLLGLIFNILACLTIVRLPCMVRQFKDMDIEEWRYVGLVQLLIFISDIPVMIASLFLIFTVYRLFPLYEELKEEDCKWDFEEKSYEIYYAGCKPRGIILKHFFLLFFDVLFIPAGLLCLCSWRCVLFIRAVKSTKDSWDRRLECYKQLGLLLTDIPCIILGAICVCSWRLPFMIHSAMMYKKRHRRNGFEEWEWKWEWDDEKWHAFRQFFYLLIDIPCILCFVISMFTWRMPFVIYNLKQIKVDDEDMEWDVRRLFICEFGLIFVDLPCIICFFIVLSTIWRLPFFIKNSGNILQHKSHKQWRIRGESLKQCGLFFIDLGCLLLAIIVSVTLWRLYPLQRDIRRLIHRKYEAARRESAGDAKEENRETDAGREIAVAAASSSTSNPDSAVAEIEGDKIRVAEADKGDKEIITEVFVASAVEEESHAISHLSNEEEVGSNFSNESSNRKSKRKTAWKIRKTICLHFVMLLVDIPAFACLCVLIVTGIRMPKILSTFLQTGDIYMEFAITIYHQTFVLFVDLIFILLFFILMLIRPVTSWICLLEDEEHMKYRLLCHHMQWVPDVVAKRGKICDAMEELVSVKLKVYAIPSNFRAALEEIHGPYMKKLKRIKETMVKLDLDPDYLHLLTCVMWWEDKRIEKITRKYTCEYNYLLRPDSSVRRDNMQKWNREMFEYNAKVSEQYTELEKFVPTKVPLWTVRTGLSTRTRKETQLVLINCLPRGDVFLMIIALLCCLPLYRAPKLIKKLYTRWYDRAHIILRTLKMYGLDVLTVLRILLVFVCIYRAPALIADISIDIVEKRSWKAVRKTAQRYPTMVLEDLFSLIKTLLSWKTPRFILTALLFFIFMPADMLLTVAKLCTANDCTAYILTGTLYAAFTSFPFVLSFYLGGKLLALGVGWVSMPVTCVYIGLLLLMLACMVRALVKNRTDLLMVPEPPDYLHWNWYNAHVVVMEILELLQLIALVFSLSDIPVYGGKVLNEISNYLLFSFISFQFKLSMAFVLFVIWFFLSGAPTIFEHILEDLTEGTCANHMGWRMAMSLFSNTLFVTMMENFASCFSCSYTKCPAGVSYDLLPSNSTCFKAYLSEAPSYDCWSGDHRLIALFGLFALLWYTTTSFMATIQYGDPGMKAQDIEFSPAYNLIANFIKAIMVISVVNITTSNVAVLIVLIAGNLVLILHTLLFKTVFKFPAASSRSFMVWRVASFSSGLIAAVAMVIAHALEKPGNKIPLIIFGAGTLVALMTALAISILLRRPGKLDETRESFKGRLLALEKRLVNDALVLGSWKEQHKTWRRLLSSVHEARKDDYIYDKAAWDSLKQREAEPEALSEPARVSSTAGDLSSLPPGVPEGAFSAEPGKEPSAQSSAKVILPAEKPPVPSYGAIRDDVPDYGDFPIPSYGAIRDDVPDYGDFPIPSHGSIKVDAPDYGLSLALQDLGSEDQPMLAMQRNGVNLLLLLENSIHYKTYAYSFLAQRSLWLSSVVASNWTGLEHCLEILEGSLDQSFERPSRMDVAVGEKALSTDNLEDDLRDQDQPPAYTPESRDPVVIAEKSLAQRMDALNDVASVEVHGGHWRELMDKILPTLPIIKSWRCESGQFDLIMKRSASGTIKDIGPNGIKLARGATLTLGKITRGRLSKEAIYFDKGFEPKGSKGPVGVTVSDIRFLWKKGTWYLESQGKSVKLTVALDCMKEIEWR